MITYIKHTKTYIHIQKDDHFDKGWKSENMCNRRQGGFGRMAVTGKQINTITKKQGETGKEN